MVDIIIVFKAIGSCCVVILAWMIIMEAIKLAPIGVTTQKIIHIPMDFNTALEIILLTSDMLGIQAELVTSTKYKDSVILYDINGYQNRPNLSEVSTKRCLRMRIHDRFAKWIQRDYFDVVLYEQNECYMLINFPGTLGLRIYALSCIQIMENFIKCISN